MKIVLWELSCSMWTDRHMMKLIVFFSDFANMPHNHYDILSGYN